MSLSIFTGSCEEALVAALPPKALTNQTSYGSNDKYDARHAKLDVDGGWRPKRNNKQEWLQVTRIRFIALQLTDI